MKFVSKYAKFGFNVKAESTRWVTDGSGNSHQVSNNDGIWIQFTTGGLTLEEQQVALEQFTRVNPQSPFGAAPKMYDDVISAQEALAEGEAHNAHEGFLPYQRLGRFDTEDRAQCNPQHKEVIESALLGSDEFGIDLFRIDNYNLTAPWPSYPEGANVKADGIVAFAKQAGFDFATVIRYEQATANRKPVLAALEVALAEQEAARTEEQALAVK